MLDFLLVIGILLLSVVIVIITHQWYKMFNNIFSNADYIKNEIDPIKEDVSFLANYTRQKLYNKQLKKKGKAGDDFEIKNSGDHIMIRLGDSKHVENVCAIADELDPVQGEFKLILMHATCPICRKKVLNNYRVFTYKKKAIPETPLIEPAFEGFVSHLVCQNCGHTTIGNMQSNPDNSILETCKQLEKEIKYRYK